MTNNPKRRARSRSASLWVWTHTDRPYTTDRYEGNRGTSVEDRSWPAPAAAGRDRASCRAGLAYLAVGMMNSGPLGVDSGQRSMMDFWRV